MLIHHTDCGVLKFTDAEFERELRDELGVAPEWAAGTFADLDKDVRRSIARVVDSPSSCTGRARVRLRRPHGRAARRELSAGDGAAARRAAGIVCPWTRCSW